MSTGTVSLRIDDRTVCERCLVADSPFARMRGLLGRSDLPRGEGVLLRPAASVHTFFMRFPIDVVFLDADGVVLDVAHELRPWRAAGAKGARTVVELAAGEAAARRIEVGATVTLDPAEDPAPQRLAFRQSAQTMAEYSVVLTVITLAIVVTIGLLSDEVVLLLERAVDALSRLRG